jgi:hypothetical protein
MLRQLAKGVIGIREIKPTMNTVPYLVEAIHRAIYAMYRKANPGSGAIEACLEW